MNSVWLFVKSNHIVKTDWTLLLHGQQEDVERVELDQNVIQFCNKYILSQASSFTLYERYKGIFSFHDESN